MCQRNTLELAGSIGAPVITANELAAELDVSVDAVLTLLTDMRELVLRSDSGVRDEVADAVRQYFCSQEANPAHLVRASDIRFAQLREKLSDTTSQPTVETRPALDFRISDKRKRPQRGRGWRPGDDRINPVTKALADQIVRSSQVWHRPEGVIFPDELAEAQQRRTAWAKACIEHGALLSDDAIISWILAFPDQVLQPATIVPLAAAGLTGDGAVLRLWYGGLNAGRPTLFQRIGWGDLTVTEAVTQVAEYRRRRSS